MVLWALLQLPGTCRYPPALPLPPQASSSHDSGESSSGPRVQRVTLLTPSPSDGAAATQQLLLGSCVETVYGEGDGGGALSLQRSRDGRYLILQASVGVSDGATSSAAPVSSAGAFSGVGATHSCAWVTGDWLTCLW